MTGSVSPVHASMVVLWCIRRPTQPPRLALLNQAIRQRSWRHETVGICAAPLAARSCLQSGESATVAGPVFNRLFRRRQYVSLLLLATPTTRLHPLQADKRVTEILLSRPLEVAVAREIRPLSGPDTAEIGRTHKYNRKRGWLPGAGALPEKEVLTAPRPLRSRPCLLSRAGLRNG